MLPPTVRHNSAAISIRGQDNQSSREDSNRLIGASLASQYKTAASAIKAEAKDSAGKEPLLTTSMGKQTPSQYDLSSGLPDCLRTNRQLPFRHRNSNCGGAPGTSAKPDSLQSRNSMTELQLMSASSAGLHEFSNAQVNIANNSSGAQGRPLADSELQLVEQRQGLDHRSFLHDFIEQADADSEIAGLVLSDSENQSSKLKLTGASTKPANRPYGLLDSEVAPHRDFEQFSKMRAAL